MFESKQMLSDPEVSRHLPITFHPDRPRVSSFWAITILSDALITILCVFTTKSKSQERVERPTLAFLSGLCMQKPPECDTLKPLRHKDEILELGEVLGRIYRHGLAKEVEMESRAGGLGIPVFMVCTRCLFTLSSSCKR